jgi:tetratricopeptide (TPR) repeat protein
MFLRALSVKEKDLGPDHRSTLRSVNDLGILYSGQEKLDEAEQMFQRALTGYEKAHGQQALTAQLLNAVNNLGNIYHKQGRLDEAETMLQRALAGHEKTQGKEALTIPLLNSVYNLGLLYHDQGRLDEAKQMFERAMAGRQEIHGRSHTQVRFAAEWLAFIRSAIGKGSSNCYLRSI